MVPSGRWEKDSKAVLLDLWSICILFFIGSYTPWGPGWE